MDLALGKHGLRKLYELRKIYPASTSALSFAGFLDTPALKATKLRTNLPKMQQHRKMRKNYHLKRTSAHPSATCGGVLQTPNGSGQMNSLKRGARVKNITTSISSTSQTGQSQKPRNRRRRFTIS
jgi:hypothetical protein